MRGPTSGNRRWTLFLGLVAVMMLVVSVAPAAGSPASAADPRGAGKPSVALVPVRSLAGSAAAELLGEWAAYLFALPAAESPIVGNAGVCFTLGRGDRVATLVVSATSPPLSCTIKAGTPLFLPAGVAVCGSTAPEPFREVTEEEQRECATQFFSLPELVAIELTVNDGPVSNIRSERFELVSPQTSANFSNTNVFGFDPGPGTLVAAGYAVTTRGRLRPGHYDFTVEFVFADNSRISVAFALDVVPGRDA